MVKFLALSAILLGTAVAFGQSHDKNTVKHAAVHAEHWVNNHANPPHRMRGHYPKRGHKDRSVHHAVVHAEHWVSHHVSPPHKH